MPRLALRIAYDGTRFCGSQRQPNVRTVEGDLLAALAKVDALQDARAGRFAMASRTDAGVSASGNVAALDTSFRASELGPAVNANLQDAWVVGVAQVPETFQPRYARSRTYAYRLPRAGTPDATALQEALALFVGEHDFTSFCRLEAGFTPVRRLRRAEAAVEGEFVTMTFEAESFLWNQIRRIVSATLALARGEAATTDVQDALAGRRVVDLGLARPQPLVLTRVDYADVRFEATGRLRAQVRARVGERLHEARLVAARAQAFLAGLPPEESV